jgi:hypothetical protein
MKHGKSIVELAQEIQRQQATKKDFVADTRAVQMIATDEPSQDGEVVEKQTDVALAWPGNGDRIVMPIGDVAHGQIAERFKVPRKFYDRLRADHPDILSSTVTALMQREPQKRMLRTLDTRVRAFLSAKYRALDNDEFFQAVFPVLQGLGVQIVSSEVTERRMYIKFLYTDLRANCPDLKPRGYQSGTINGGQFQGMDAADIIAGGVIHNSEVGHGAIGVKDLDFNLWCLNGCVRESVVKQTHVGRAAGLDGLDASEFYKDSTRRLDDAAFFSKVKDTLEAMFSRERFDARIEQMRGAKADVIDVASAVPEVVEVVSKRLSLTDGQQESVLDAVIRDGDLSRWGIANAITAVSQKVESYDRASEMEEMGGKVLELQPRDWTSILNEAKRATA